MLRTAARETLAEPQARRAARGPQGSGPPCATRQRGLTWRQDDRLPLPPVSIVANDVSLLCTAAKGREGQLGPQGPHPSAQAPLSRATCAQPAQHLSARRHRPAHNPTAWPQGPCRAQQPGSRTSRPGRPPRAPGTQPPWVKRSSRSGDRPPPLPLTAHSTRGRECPSPTGPTAGLAGITAPWQLRTGQQTAPEPSEDLGSPRCPWPAPAGGGVSPPEDPPQVARDEVEAIVQMALGRDLLQVGQAVHVRGQELGHELTCGRGHTPRKGGRTEPLPGEDGPPGLRPLHRPAA